MGNMDLMGNFEDAAGEFGFGGRGGRGVTRKGDFSTKRDLKIQN